MNQSHGVIFDIDGTLVLSNAAHTRSWVEAFAEHGYQVEFDQVYKLIGMGGDKLVKSLFPQLSDEEGVGKEIKNSRQEIFLDRYASNLQPTPGARDLVQRVRDAGMKVAVASSAKSNELEILLERADVKDLFEQTTTSDDAKESKPDPDIVSVALDKLGLSPRNVLMIGDTPYDIESAARANVDVVAVRCGGWDNDTLHGAVAVYQDPLDLVQHFEESPLNRWIDCSDTAAAGKQ